MKPPYVTIPRRRVASVFLGAGLGGLLSFGGLMLLPEAPQSLLRNGVLPIILICCGAFGLFWLAGIGLVAAPLWRLVERKHALGWPAAVLWGTGFGFLLGLVLVAIVLFLMRNLGPSISEVLFGPVAVIASAFAAMGCVVGLAMWRYAYRRQPVADVAETFS